MKVKKISVVLAGLFLLALCIASHSFGVTITHEYDELNRLIRTTVEDTTAQIPVVSFSANPATIYEGDSSTLTWSSTYATSCEIDQGIGIVTPPEGGSVDVSPTVTTTYTITATGPGGTATDSVTVTVEPLPPPPTVSISADPASIDYGGTSTLSWTSTDADSCEIDQGIGTVNTNGSHSVSPTVTTTYTITATGVSGTATDTVTVTVVPAPGPTVEISADPVSIEYGASSTLSWTSTNAHTVTIDQGIGEVELIDTLSVSPTVTTTYTITATGAGGTATDTVTITVGPAPEPTVQISADPATIQPGESSTLTWSSTDADTCNIQPGIGEVGTEGDISVSPTVTTEYTITATGPGGTATDTATVTIAPTVSITASPEAIERGDSSTLMWDSNNADTVSIDQGIGAVDPQGSMDVYPIITMTYTITATGAGGTATDSATVTVTLPVDNSFSDPINWHDYVADFYSWNQFWVNDYNGDGKADILYLSNAPYKYMVMLSNGSGFDDPVNWHDYVTDFYAWNQFWVNDYNSDGKADIMYLSNPPYRYMVMLSNGSGFADPVNWHDYVPIGYSWDQFWVNDYNSDGKADIMHLSTSPYKYMVMLSTGEGFADPVNWHDYVPIGYSWDQFWVSDFNGDGTPDIMFLSISPYRFMVMENNSSP